MINILEQNVVNQIAAGEVVERPASVLKELIENSIDAGSTDIKVYIKEFGTEKIQVTDNGSGIEKADLERVFLKHATSKISKSEDLDSINTFGFRGEALASISSVSKVILQSKHVNDEVGSEAVYENGSIKSIRPSAISAGTDLQVLNLFENVPARKKFLKAKSTENKTLLEVFHKFVLANPKVSFYIDIDGTTKTYSIESIKSRAAKIFKIDQSSLVEIYYDGTTKVSGFVIHPRVFLKSRSSQYVFVNKRPVTDGTIYKAISDGYDTFLMRNQIPGFVAFIDVQPLQVDVNVHPRKTEVRFANPSEVYKSVKLGVNVNLVKFLREETQSKLNLRPEAKLDTDYPTYPHVSEVNSAEYRPEINRAQEFAEFLSSPAKKLEPTFLAQLDTGAMKAGSSQALLFNHQMLNFEGKNEPVGIYLDYANATQLMESYLVTTNGKDILIIDQHAASERYFYEKYLKQLKSKKVESKVLLFPEIIHLESFEIKTLESQKELFTSMGFDFDQFGDEEIRFIRVPEFIKMENFQKIAEKIIVDILEHGEISNIRDKIFHEIAAILACHTAVRFGDKLTREEIVSLLKNLAKCEDPYNCPHGRPTIQDFSKYDIEKKFKRCSI